MFRFGERRQRNRGLRSHTVTAVVAAVAALTCWVAIHHFAPILSPAHSSFLNPKASKFVSKLKHSIPTIKRCYEDSSQGISPTTAANGRGQCFKEHGRCSPTSTATLLHRMIKIGCSYSAISLWSLLLCTTSPTSFPSAASSPSNSQIHQKLARPPTATEGEPHAEISPPPPPPPPQNESPPTIPPKTAHPPVVFPKGFLLKNKMKNKVADTKGMARTLRRTVNLTSAASRSDGGNNSEYDDDDDDDDDGDYSDIRENEVTKNIRWSLLYEPLAGRYGVVPADIGVTIQRRKHEEEHGGPGTNHHHHHHHPPHPPINPDEQQYMKKKPWDFGSLADVFNDYDQMMYMGGEGTKRIVGDIHLQETEALVSRTSGEKENDATNVTTMAITTTTKKNYSSSEEKSQLLPGVAELGMPVVLQLKNESLAKGNEEMLVLGQKRDYRKDPIELRKERDMLIQTRAAITIAERNYSAYATIMNRLSRRDKEDLDTHMLGARIVFDMSYEDLKYERDDAYESITDQFDRPSNQRWEKLYPHINNTLTYTLRRRGQQRAFRWWHELRSQVGNQTALRMIRRDKYLRRMGISAEWALGIGPIAKRINCSSHNYSSYSNDLIEKKEAAAATTEVASSPSSQSSAAGHTERIEKKLRRDFVLDSLSAQRAALLEWAVRDM